MLGNAGARMNDQSQRTTTGSGNNRYHRSFEANKKIDCQVLFFNRILRSTGEDECRLVSLGMVFGVHRNLSSVRWYLM